MKKTSLLGLACFGALGVFLSTDYASATSTRQQILDLQAALKKADPSCDGKIPVVGLSKVKDNQKVRPLAEKISGLLGKTHGTDRTAFFTWPTGEAHDAAIHLLEKVAGKAQQTPPSPEPEPQPIVQKTVEDLINTITRANVTVDNQVDLMNAILQQFENGEEGSIAKRVYDEVSKKKGKRKAEYMPKKVDLSEWSEAISTVRRSDFHVENEEGFVSSMVTKFEEFKIKDPSSCIIV